MKFPLRFFVAFTFLMIALCRVHGEDKLYLLEDRANLSCHFNSQSESNLVNEAKVEEIDRLLDALYDAIQKNGTYEQDCNDTIDFEFEFLTTASNGAVSKNSTTVDVEFEQLLEGFEIQRDRYKNGLWGYCADEGVDELIRNITAVTETADSSPVILCDRDQLLNCHPKYKKCQCMVNNKNFRDIVSEYWNDTAEQVDSGHSVGKSFCALLTGSNCPSGNETSFMCIPGSVCRHKSNRTKPCNHLHESIDISTITKRSLGKSQVKRDFDDDIDGSFTSNNLRTNASDQTSNASNPLQEVNGKSADLPGVKRYRFVRHDYPNVHCQCYAYVGGSGKGKASAVQPSWRKLISQIVCLFVMFYMFL